MSMAIMAFMVGTAVCGAAQEGWQAGVAKLEITPEKPMWMAGYAGRDHAAEGTLHPLWVKALALQDAQGNRAVLVTSDILGFSKRLSDRIRNTLEERLDLNRAQIILNSSHSHTTPVIDDTLIDMYKMEAADLEKVKAYAAYLEPRVVQVVEEAFKNLAPAELASQNGVTRFAVNRRNNKEGEIKRTYAHNGPVDHSVPVLRVMDGNGKAKAVVFGYACHCTTLSSYEWSGDYAGFAQIALEEADPDCMALFFAGCGANQNPLPRRTVALAKQYGTELAAAVTRVLEEPMRPLDATLVTAYEEPILKLQEPKSREELEKIVETAAWYMSNSAAAMVAELDAGRALRTEYPYPMNMWKLGDQAIVALGGEVVVDYAVFIKEKIGHETFVMGYSNDVMSYIPSEVVLEEGGYEGDTSQMIYGMPAKWKPGIEKDIMDTIGILAKAADIPVLDAQP